jgi:hypothetical protein
MRGGVLLGPLEALLLGLARFLLARLAQVVSGRILHPWPAQQPEGARDQATQGTTPGASSTEDPGKGIETSLVHGFVPWMMRTNR